MVATQCEPVYRAIKLLSAAQYDSIVTGKFGLPEGVSVVDAKQGVDVKVRSTPIDKSAFAVVFEGSGPNALFSFYMIPCIMSILITMLPEKT